jgi:SAM-dependent methyltransferase
MKSHEISQEQSDTGSLSSSNRPGVKRVSIQERSFTMGNIIGINGYHVNRASLKRQLAEKGYQIRETPHFLLCLHPEAPTILVHWFAPKAIDADLGHYFMEELKSFGILAHPQGFGNVIGAVVGSVYPHDPWRAWYLFGTNTLERYHSLLGSASSSPRCDFPVEVFATLYKRVCELQVGESLLDAGCSFGFLPLVVAERIPLLHRVLGVDIRTDPFRTSRAIALEHHLTNIQFTQADLLAEDFHTIGQFDTVTVLHVLEHFTEADMYRALANLLKVTSRRLIIAVPYEPGEPETAYGHEQLFSRDKLEAVGHWCLQQLGNGETSCEDCMGGLLLIDIPH